VVLLWVWGGWGAQSVQAEGAWETLEGCQLTRNDSNDGDSFHVRHNGQDYIFRLYFVDTPESDEMFPARVQEQAEVFGTDTQRVLAVGKEATRFAARQLARPFTVVTQRQDARGMSRLPRYFAFVTTADGQDLGELLVAKGLARSYGVAAAPPGKRIEQLRREYDTLQARAKASKLGAWGGARGRAVADLSSEDEPEAAEADAGSEDLVAKVWASSALLFEPVEELPDSSLEATEVQTPVEEVPVAPGNENPGVTKDGKVDLNHATVGELQTLPGIDAATAEAIVAARPLAGFHELLRIPGITPATLREIFPLIVE
jgi:endonuclease YncB( thermonuclease family)